MTEKTLSQLTAGLVIHVPHTELNWWIVLACSNIAQC